MSKKRLNLHEQGYKAGDPMWVSWDKRWDGPMRRELMWEGVYQEERLVTTIGFFRYDDREFLALDRTKRPNGCEDIIYIPTPLVKEYGKFHAEQYSTFIRYIFVYNTLVSERLNVRIRRYAEATNYAKVLTGVYNGIPKGENGMIIKYQEPAQPIKYMGGYDKRGNIVLPVNNENGMNNVTLPEVTVTPRNINLAGAVDRGRRTVGNMGKEILSATTPLGDIESAKDIYQDARSGNYGQAALGAGLLLLPNFIEKPLKTLKRVGKDYVIITKDFVSSPKRFRQARKDGTYPLTYKERRRYLEEAHKVGDKAAARVDAANIGDYQYRVNNYPNTYHAVNLVDGVNTRYTFNSKSYKNFDDANHSSGVNSSSWNINSHINIKKSPNSKYLIPTGGADGVGANVAHELQHSYQKVLPDITLMTSTRNGQRLVNEEHITANALAPLKGKAGTWEGNPRELNSEVMSIRTGLNAPRYNLMTPEQQGIMKYYIGRKFDLDDNVVHNMLNELGKLGYKNGGKL